MRTTQPITTKLGSYISLVMTWLDHLIRLWSNSVRNPFFGKFSSKISDVFVEVKHSIGHISGMVGPIDVKWKGGASVRYWVNYVTLTFDLTHGLDLWFFKVKFQNSCIWGIAIWLMWNKKKANLLDTALWPHPWPWPCSLKVKVWNSLIWGMGVGHWLTQKKRAVSRSFMTMIVSHLCVTMVGVGGCTV